MVTSSMTLWQYGITRAHLTMILGSRVWIQVPEAPGANFRKEKSVAIPAENVIFCRFRSRPQMSQKSSYDNKGTIKMTVYIHVTLTSDLGYKTFLNSNYYYTTADMFTMKVLLHYGSNIYRFKYC